MLVSFLRKSSDFSAKRINAGFGFMQSAEYERNSTAVLWTALILVVYLSAEVEADKSCACSFTSLWRRPTLPR